MEGKEMIKRIEAKSQRELLHRNVPKSLPHESQLSSERKTLPPGCQILTPFLQIHLVVWES